MVVMNIPDYILTIAPSTHTMEKALDILSAMAPRDATIASFLNTFALFAPKASSVWMLPLAALVLSMVHAVITRRASMMVGAACLLCFYTAGNFLLPLVEVPTEEQMVLLTTLHLWFSCIAAYIVFICIVCSLTTHIVALLWRHYSPPTIAVNPPEQKLPPKTIVASQTKKAPVPRPRKVAALTHQTPALNKITSSQKKLSCFPKKQLMHQDSTP